MPGIVQQLDLIINQGQLGKTVADAQKAGADIGNAIGNAPAVKDAARKLGEAIGAELQPNKAVAKAKAYVQGLERTIQLAQADIREAQARGLLTDNQARQRGAEAGRAFNAGILSQIQQLSQAGALSGRGGQDVFVELSGKLKNANTAAIESARGFGTVRSAMFSLAAQASSTQGPLGSLANGLLTFAGGGLIALGVASVLGAIAIAINSIIGSATRASDALKKLNDQFRTQQTAKAGPVAQINEQIKDLQEGIVDDQKALAELLNRALAFGGVGATAVGLGLFSKQFKDAKEQIDAARQAITKLKQERDALFAAGQATTAFGSMTAGHFDAGLSAGAGHGGGGPGISLGPTEEELARKREQRQRKAIADAKELAAQLDAVTEAGRRLEGQAHLTAVEWGDKAFKEINDKAEEEEQKLQDLQDAWDQYQQSAQDAIESLLTPEEIHLEYLDKQRNAFLDITDAAQGLIEVTNRIGALGDAAAQTFTDLNNVAVSLKEISLTGASFTNVANLVQTGIGLIGDVVHAIHRNKDPGRLRTNEQMFERAMNGDTEALEFLRTHSVVSHNGSVGWGSQEAATDAHAKYMEAKAVQDAQAQPAKDAANAQHDAEIAAMQKQAGLDQQRLNEQAQVSQHEAQAAMDHRAQVFKDANRLGLGSAAANTGALFQAAAIAGQGALGHDSPLYVEAEKKAEDALRDLERQVEQAQKQVDDAKQTKADQAGGVMAGFTVQRSITQASGDRLVGELTTQTVYLKQIRDAVAPQGGGAAAGILAALPPIQVTTITHLDGEKVAKVVSHHQSKRLQHQQAMNGNSSMPA